MSIMAETKHSMLRRCRHRDYRQPCAHQITLVPADRRSQAPGRPVIPSGTEHASGSVLETAASSYIALTPTGEAVKKRESYDKGN